MNVGDQLGPYSVTAKIGEGRADRGLIQRRDLLLTTPVGLSFVPTWSCPTTYLATRWSQWPLGERPSMTACVFVRYRSIPDRARRLTIARSRPLKKPDKPVTRDRVA